MDISELETLAESALKGSPKDLQMARAKFVRFAIRDPQAIFVMSDEATKLSIAEDWFAGFAKRTQSPKGVGAARYCAPDRATTVPPLPNISSLAERPPPNLGLHRCASDETPSEGVAEPDTPKGAHPGAPSSSEPHPSGAASLSVPDTGHRPNAAPARPQSIADITAARRGAQEMVRTVFDSFRVRDGRSIGDVRMGELGKLEATNRHEAGVLRRLRLHVVPYDPNITVREAVSTSVLERMIQGAAEEAQAVNAA